LSSARWPTSPPTKTYDLLGLESGGKPLFKNELAVAVLAVAIVAVMTAIVVIGTEISARLQRVLTFFQIGALAVFATRSSSG
jgi:amino acid transporter